MKLSTSFILVCLSILLFVNVRCDSKPDFNTAFSNWLEQNPSEGAFSAVGDKLVNYLTESLAHDENCTSAVQNRILEKLTNVSKAYDQETLTIDVIGFDLIEVFLPNILLEYNKCVTDISPRTRFTDAISTTLKNNQTLAHEFSTIAGGIHKYFDGSIDVNKTCTEIAEHKADALDLDLVRQYDQDEKTPEQIVDNLINVILPDFLQKLQKCVVSDTYGFLA